MAQIPNKMKQLAGAEEVQAAEFLFQRGGVRELSATAEALNYVVTDNPVREIQFTIASQPKCGCDTFKEKGSCRHLLAAMLLANEKGNMDSLMHNKALAAGPRLLDAVDTLLPAESTIKMEVSIYAEKPDGKTPKPLRIGLRVGEERLYVVRSIPQFIQSLETGEPLDFGKGFTFHPEWMNFGPAQTRILEIIRNLCVAQKDFQTTMHGETVRLLTIPFPFAEAILSELTNLSFRMIVGGETIGTKRVRKTTLPLHYRVNGSLRVLTVTGIYPAGLMPLIPNCSFVLIGENVIQVDPHQQHMLKVLWQEELYGRSIFEYPMRDVDRVVSELLPTLKLTGVVELSSELDHLLLKLPLIPRIYLDREGKDVVARTVFRYGDREIDPFAETPVQEQLHKGEQLLLRDATAERQVLDTLGASGFFVSKGRVYLSGAENIFNFVSEGVSKLQALAELFLSRDFQKMKPRKPMLKGKMQLKDGRLELQFTEDGEPAEEVLAIMEALSKRRKYFRLKDGSFLDLSSMDEWQPLANNLFESAALEGITPQSADGDTITLRSYRTCYLNSLLDMFRLPIERDDSIAETVQALTDPDHFKAELPKGLSLRSYQERGYQWLSTLDRLHMGGILADDMGLGKTVQVISLLKANQQSGHVSLVVAPTSLTYNWLSELTRFAPELSVMVMQGSSAQRASQINHIQKAKDIDVLITSYPLIRRDIELLREIPFRFAILDEAQQIKNAGSVGAVAVKQLQAQTRFALTGTPMENSAGELWSIFDFVLPGYLNSYNAFLRRYQDGQELDDLRTRIRPFLMRRLKKDVLTELPDKIETIMTAQMTPEQQKVYQSAMLRLRDRVDHVMTEKGLGRGRTEVLAAITELRQICCHPSLILEDYTGTSGKMEMLMDVLPDALGAGRRILLFSQFTSMLKILLRQLESAGYKCMYLDGETAPAKRIEMTEQFNAGQAQIFLISLKAGGTGLNLTGADMVIHFDPWWNPAAEDQATDRAHRIGQTRKVEVIRMVTHGSIEEQVVELGRRKKALFDQLITPGEELVTALSEADIRALFA